jgi:hypothetical protein
MAHKRLTRVSAETWGNDGSIEKAPFELGPIVVFATNRRCD